jgi:hypothetical protein
MCANARNNQRCGFTLSIDVDEHKHIDRAVYKKTNEKCRCPPVVLDVEVAEN